MRKFSNEFVTALRTLFELPKADINKLVSALTKLEYGLGYEEKVESAVAASGVGSGDEIEKIRRSIVVLHYLYANSGQNLDEFSNEIASSLEQAFRDIDLNISVESIQATLSGVFSAIALRISAKASTLILDAERGFLRARIITDIRPVFGDNITEPDIAAAMVIHTLKIAYQDNDENEFFVNMTTKDLQQFKTVIDRALQKAEGVQKILPSLTKHVIEPD